MSIREVVTLISLLSSLIHLASPTLLDLHLFPSTNSTLLCNDGTPSGYYFRPADPDADEEAANLWIVQQEAGGWCWDPQSCVDRILGLSETSPHLISSNSWAPQRDIKGLFEASPGSRFSQANLVFIPYCSSDAHLSMGQEFNLDFGPDEGGIRKTFFNGQIIHRTIVQNLIGDLEDQMVLFGGFSAGARGAMVTIDFLHEVLPPSTTIKGFMDSGAYQDISPFDPNYSTSFGEQCRLAYEMYTPRINQACAEAYPGDDLWKCNCGEYALPLIQTPSHVTIHQYDSYQVSSNLGAEPDQWTAEMCAYIEDIFRPGMLSTVGDTSDAGRHVVFGPACYAHAVGTTDLFQSVRIGGINSEDQLEAFVFDGTLLDLVSDCDGINCEASCPQEELSPEATVCIARKGEKGQLSYYIAALIGMIYNIFDMS